MNPRKVRKCLMLAKHSSNTVYNYTMISSQCSDHAEGNEKLVSMVTGLTVCGNDDRIGALNKTVKHNDQFKVRIYGFHTHPPTHTVGGQSDCDVSRDSVSYKGAHLLLCN